MEIGNVFFYKEGHFKFISDQVSSTGGGDMMGQGFFGSGNAGGGGLMGSMMQGPMMGTDPSMMMMFNQVSETSMVFSMTLLMKYYVNPL